MAADEKQAAEGGEETTVSKVVKKTTTTKVVSSTEGHTLPITVITLIIIIIIVVIIITIIIATVSTHDLHLAAEADLGMFSMFGRTGTPQKGPPQEERQILQHSNMPEIIEIIYRKRFC